MPVIGRRPAVSGMADIALLRGAEVILILTRRLDTIVAGRTRSEHLGMVDRDYRCENIR